MNININEEINKILQSIVVEQTNNEELKVLNKFKEAIDEANKLPLNQRRNIYGTIIIYLLNEMNKGH